MFNGKYIYYDSLGKVHQTGYYINDAAEGKWTTYYENGQPSTVSFYKADKVDSLFTEYHPNGKIDATGYFKNGLEEGKWMFYDTIGNAEFYRIYSKGKILKETKTE